MNEYLLNKLKEERARLFPEGWNDFANRKPEIPLRDMLIMTLKNEAYDPLIELIEGLGGETSYEEAHKWIAQYVWFHMP